MTGIVILFGNVLETYKKKTNIINFFTLSILCLPIACSLLGIKSMELHLGVSLLCLYLILIQKKSVQIFLPKKLLLIFIVFITLLTLQVVSGRGFVILAAGGYVFIICLIFIQVLCKTQSSQYFLVVIVNKALAFLLLLLAAELGCVLLDYQSCLIECIPDYKRKVSADFFAFMPLLAGASGLNSILLGSQSAGMISVLGIIWFSGYQKKEKQKVFHLSKTFWLTLSYILFILTIGLTSTFLFILGVLTRYMGSFKKFFLCFAIALLSIVFLIIFESKIKLFQRYSDNDFVSQTELENIKNNFGYMGPLITRQHATLIYFSASYFSWLKIKPLDKLIGVGKQPFINGDYTLGGDCAFLTGVLLKTGLIWTLTFISFIFLSLYKLRRTPISIMNHGALFHLNKKLFAMILILFCSLVHYGPAIESIGFTYLFGIFLSFAYIKGS